MEEIPKKVLQINLCYICSVAVDKKEKIYIFGKSSVDLSAIFRSSLDVTVSSYSDTAFDTSELSICKSCLDRRLTLILISLS